MSSSQENLNNSRINYGRVIKTGLIMPKTQNPAFEIKMENGKTELIPQSFKEPVGPGDVIVIKKHGLLPLRIWKKTE